MTGSVSQFSPPVVSEPLWPMNCSMPGFPVQRQLPPLAQTHVCRVSDAIQPSHPLSSPSLPSVFPRIRVFSSESVLHIRWPRFWSFSFSINPSNEYSGLTSFRTDWLDLLAVQETPKSLLQIPHTVQKHQLIGTQLSLWSNSHIHTRLLEKPYLTRQTFVSKVTSLLFNTLSRLIIAFLPRSKRLLISWLQSLSAVILEPPKISKIYNCFHFFLFVCLHFFTIYLPQSDGTKCYELHFLNVEF